MDPHRAQRLAEAIREELYELINFRLKDPRIGPVDLSAIELSPDGRKAVVRVLWAGEQQDPEQGLAALTHAKGFLRRELATALDLYRVPDLYFEAAIPGAQTDRMAGLLKRIRRGRPKE